MKLSKELQKGKGAFHLGKLRRKRHQFSCFIRRDVKKAERDMDRKGQGFNYFLMRNGDNRYRGTQYRGVKHYWNKHSWSE